MKKGGNIKTTGRGGGEAVASGDVGGARGGGGGTSVSHTTVWTDSVPEPPLAGPETPSED